MTDSLEPSAIARRTFDVVRRGYEQQEVRGFLHEVSALLERLARSEHELRERAERAEAKLGASAAPDEAMLLAALGEETTRVLTSAREAAAEIRAKAEEAAARVIAEATSEAAEIRSNAVSDADALRATTAEEREATLEAARTELDRRRAEAEEVAAQIRAEGEAAAAALREEGQVELARAKADAEAAVAAARQEGRAMVAEAQAVRERVLRDLAVRRKRARQQVEKLNAGRERLLEAYEVVRRTVGEATDELTISLSDARLAADAAARRIDEEPEPTLAQLDEEVANAGLIDLPIAELGPDADVDDDEQPGPFSGEVPAITPTTVPDEPVAEEAPVPGGPAAIAVPRPAELDDRRARKRRKRGFEGLPPGELTVLQPPSEHEGVRILAEPAGAAPVSPADTAGAPAPVEATADTADRVAPTTSTSESVLASPTAPDAEPTPEPGPEPEAAVGPEPGVAFDATDEPVSDATAELDTEATAEPVPAAQTGSDATAEPDTEATADSAAASESEPEPELEAPAEAGPVSDPAPAWASEAESTPESTSEIQAEPEPGTASALAVGPQTEPAPEPEAPTLAESEGEAEVEAAATGPESAVVEPVDLPSHDDAQPSGAEPASVADDVFARLRAESGGESAPGEASDVAPAPDEPEDARVDPAARPFVARAAALASVDKELTRRLKRALADEQNEVLDLLRRVKPKGVDDLLPGVDDHAARWAEAAAPALVDAAAAGADWSGGVSSPVADLADELARALTVPLRERIERSFSASDGNLDDVADRVRALYREWKGTRLSETSVHFCGAAYARGLFDGVARGALVHWVVDPAAGACPDCDDNVLAGAIAKGSEFPTGNPCAPAHPGCHCLVLAVEV